MFSGSAGGLADPNYLLDPFPFVGGYASDASGRTPVDPRLVEGEKTAVVVTLGQSNSCNTASGGAYTPTNTTKLQNLNLWDGGVYQAADPLLGCTQIDANWATRFGDQMISAGHYDRLILCPAGISATSIAQWAVGGIWNHRIGVVCKRLAALGLTPTIILWAQGEADAAGTTTQQQYIDRLTSVVNTFRGLGAKAPFFVAQSTWQSGGLQTNSSAIRAAQAAIVNHNLGIWAGPDTDNLDNSYRRDGTHFNQFGAASAANAWQAAVEAWI